MQFEVPLRCVENNHKWIFFIFEGDFECKKMKIINLGRLVFEDVNGPEGHLRSLNFFQKALHIHSKSLQKNFWSAPCSLKHLLGVKKTTTNGFFYFEGNLQGNFYCKKMEIRNLGRFVFEGVNGPQGHQCALKFF